MDWSNPWFVFVCAVVLGFALFDFWVETLNLKALRPRMPAEVQGFFDEDRYARAVAYERENTRFDLISGLFSLAVFLAFWWLGGFAWTLDLAKSWFDRPLPAALCFFSLLYVGKFLISLPFSWYETFVIEEKFGFNRTTPRTFLIDRVKGLIIAAVIGLPILAFILWIFLALPHAWLWAWGALTLISLGMIWLQPVVILPMFHKLTPLPDGELRASIFAMAKRCGFPMDNVFTVDGSRRSTKGNAFFTGFGSAKRIALFDTLIESLKPEEIVAVLAHEIGHQKRGHIPRRLILGIATMGLYLFLMDRFMREPGLHSAFGIAPELMIPATGLAFFSFIFEPLSRVTGILSSMMSRRHEFEADAYAADATDGPSALVNALKRLASQNLANLTPHPLHVFLSHSHPPLLERVKALRQADSAA